MKNSIFAMIAGGAMCVLPLLGSCGSDSVEMPSPPGPGTEIPESPAESLKKKVILVYAVGTNNLAPDLASDKNEMLDGFRDVDTTGYSLLVYQVIRRGEASLLEAVRENGRTDFRVVKEYDNETLSTDPARISQVLQDVRGYRPSESYGLIMWAHGSNWEPGGTPHTGISPAQAPPVCYAYGGDESTDHRDWTDIDELADAIPDGMLEFLWFDNCFMGSIEVAYQMRDKARYMVAYPTEIYSPGMPYNETVPLLLLPKARLIEAADATFNYYKERSMACTMAVLDLSNIEAVADLCAQAHAQYGPVDVSGLQDYSRFQYGPYYDFGQYTKRMGETSPSFVPRLFDRTIKSLVIHKACSDFNFRGNPIDEDNYSGLSTHAYGVQTRYDDYYRTLDWYERIMGSASVPGIRL